MEKMQKWVLHGRIVCGVTPCGLSMLTGISAEQIAYIFR
jgi:hypothetical protein